MPGGRTLVGGGVKARRRLGARAHVGRDRRGVAAWGRGWAEERSGWGTGWGFWPRLLRTCGVGGGGGTCSRSSGEVGDWRFRFASSAASTC